MGYKPKENAARPVAGQEVVFDREQWVEDVLADEYILVVGSEVILDTAFEPTGDVKTYLLRQLNEQPRPLYQDYNDLNPRDDLRAVLENCSFELKEMSPELCALVRTRLFPIVLTTTFDGYLEALMRSVWGDRLRIVSIEDKKSLDDLRNTLREYRGAKFREPTLFYIFGKAVKDESKRYVRTDDDAIQIIEKWILMPEEDPILSLIKSRKLMALGCKFDDWYFRFFWFVLRREIQRFREGQVAFSLDEGDRSDRQLKSFLARSQVCTHPDARQFMREAAALFGPEGQKDVLRELIRRNRRDGGVFLSYCNEDVREAERLFVQLVKAGYNVWFDNERLHGGNDYDRSIDGAIAGAKVFLSLLSPQVCADTEAGATDRYYRKEWSLARQWESLGVIPVAIDGYALRDPRHAAIFENEFPHRHTGIDLTQKDGFARLTQAIDDYLQEA